jgi:hypothetical protein
MRSTASLRVVSEPCSVEGYLSIDRLTCRSKSTSASSMSCSLVMWSSILFGISRRLVEAAVSKAARNTSFRSSDTLLIRELDMLRLFARGDGARRAFSHTCRALSLSDHVYALWAASIQGHLGSSGFGHLPSFASAVYSLVALDFVIIRVRVAIESETGSRTGSPRCTS